ncbi:urease accessory protein UreF [Alicyclobacillus herbarius]|uniref:urease accessory protein UreF n=1 Tax=Alicyclobacillus herbarius TaxID=122960 RepID=UPI001B7FD451|nr:urease accessory protein UreF [Alicyclobacillus herbarius]
MDALLTLLQLYDSNFPSGAYAHSLGLETYIQDGRVRDAKTFREYLEAHLRGPLVYTDGFAFRIVHEAAQEHDFDRIASVDERLYVNNVPQETRTAACRMGTRLVMMARTLFPDDALLMEYAQGVRKGHVHGHPAVVYGLAAYAAGVEMSLGLAGYLYSSLAVQVQNGVRAIPLGQTDGQLLLLALRAQIPDSVSRVLQLQDCDFGAVSPGLEMAQLRHNQLHVRIFMSKSSGGMAGWTRCVLVLGGRLAPARPCWWIN